MGYNLFILHLICIHAYNIIIYPIVIFHNVMHCNSMFFCVTVLFLLMGKLLLVLLLQYWQYSATSLIPNFQHCTLYSLCHLFIDLKKSNLGYLLSKGLVGKSG